VSPGRVRQLIDAGRLPAMQVSPRSVILKESDLLAFMEHERAPGRPRLYEVLVEPGTSVAHIGQRGGALVGLCGSSGGAAWVHRPGEQSDLRGARLCHRCRDKAP